MVDNLGNYNIRKRCAFAILQKFKRMLLFDIISYRLILWLYLGSFTRKNLIYVFRYIMWYTSMKAKYVYSNLVHVSTN